MADERITLNIKTAAQMCGRFVASHSGSGLWVIVDSKNQDSGPITTADILFTVTPVGFTGDLGLTSELPAFTTADVNDLVNVLAFATKGVKMGGWEKDN